MCRSLICFDEDVIIRLDLVCVFREIPDDEVTHHFLAQRERGAIHFQVVRFENRQNRYVLFTRVDQVYDLGFLLCLFLADCVRGETQVTHHDGVGCWDVNRFRDDFSF